MNARKKTAALCAVLLCATAVCGWFEWRALTTPAYVYEAKEYLKEAAAAGEIPSRSMEYAYSMTLLPHQAGHRVVFLGRGRRGAEWEIVTVDLFDYNREKSGVSGSGQIEHAAAEAARREVEMAGLLTHRR